MDNRPTSIPEIAAQMKSSIVSDKFGDIPLWSRLRLWDTWTQLKPAIASEQRSCFAIRVASELLPEWDRANFPDKYCHYPRDAVRFCQHFLSGECTRHDIVELHDMYCDNQQYFLADCDFQEYGCAIYVYIATTNMLGRAIDYDDYLYNREDLYYECWFKDMDLRPTEYVMADPQYWDVHFVASIMNSRGATWENKFSDRGRREAFWRNWIARIPLFSGSLGIALRNAGIS